MAIELTPKEDIARDAPGDLYVGEIKAATSP